MQEIVLCGDAIEQLRTLESDSVHTCITSPPYYNLRDYGVHGQIGAESTPEEYIERLTEIFREVRRVLRPDGTLWLNIGDGYAAKATAGIKAKDLIGIPWMLAFALRADGWFLRQDIIWHKPNAMPESVKDRCTKSHEYIFLLTKSPRYYFDHEAIKEPCSEANVRDFQRRKTMNNKGRGLGTYEEARPDLCRSREAYMPKDFRRNRRDVWSIPTHPYKGAHFATFPEKLIEPCVLAGSPEGGTVLDPFTGSGTTGVVAKRTGRNFVGVELNPEYQQMAVDRIAATAPSINQLQLI